MENCIFCKIANKEIPGKIVYEDDLCLAFLDLSQTTNGHTLVVPKTHYQNILDVDKEVLSHLIKVTKKLTNQIITNLDAKGACLPMQMKWLVKLLCIFISILFQDIMKQIKSKSTLLIVVKKLI